MSADKEKQSQEKEHQSSQFSDGIDRAPLKIIARIRTDFPTKFGIPRQSGMINALKGKIIFEPEYRNPDAFRGLEGFSHIWLLWEFSEAVRDSWSPMVKPPRLGGNKRMGVFATRSPYRPNSIGLSSVKLDRIDLYTEDGPILYVSGVDLMDNTPIYDIKPYLPYTDCHSDAVGGFTDTEKYNLLEVIFPEALLNILPAEHREAVMGILAHDPRPAYQNDPNRRYGVEFAGYDVRFTVKDRVLTVCEVELLSK